MVFVKRRPSNKSGTDNSLKLIYEFSNRVFKSGVLMQARKNRFKKRDETKTSRRERALFRKEKQKKLVEDFKLGKQDSFASR